MNSWKTKSGYTIFQILSGRSNVFILTNYEKNILIDTSTARNWNRLENELAKLKIDHIDVLILTHTHHDHAANAHRIKKKFNSTIIVHSAEADYLNRGINLIPNGTTLLTRILVKLFAKKYLSKFKYDPCEYDILIDSTYDLKTLGFNAYIMHTPGHSPGSMSVIIDDEMAIVGDAMFGVFKNSVFPPYADNIKQMIVSWGKLLETNCNVFIPAHGTANTRALVTSNYQKRMSM